MLKAKTLTGVLALLLFTVFACAHASAQGVSKGPSKGAAADQANAPVIVCDKPDHDFGTVAQGQEVEHVFKIRNKGKGVLKIERARGG